MMCYGPYGLSVALVEEKKTPYAFVVAWTSIANSTSTLLGKPCPVSYALRRSSIQLTAQCSMKVESILESRVIRR